jgi:putative DNA methylase
LVDYNRTLIEHIFPIEIISTEARKEKNSHPLFFEIHNWWNRTPLIIARAIVLASCLNENFDILEFEELLGFHDYHNKRVHNYNLNLHQKKNLEKIFKEYWGRNKLTILDPFSGGGSIPFESLRIGFNTYSSDYNPLAYLIQKSSIEYPKKYGEKLLNDVSEGLNWLYLRAEDELKDFYPENNGEESVNYLHSWVVNCPQCGFNNPLVTQWWLVKRNNKRLYLDPEVDGNNLKLIIKNDGTPSPGNLLNGEGKCLKCGESIPKEYVKEEILNKEEEMPLATVTLGEYGKNYHLPTPKELDVLIKIKKLSKEIEDFLLDEDLLPNGEISVNGDVGLYLKNWQRLLNPRQMLVFGTLTKLIREYQLKLAEDMNEDYVTAIITYMTFVLGKHLNKNCRSTKYDRRRENVSGGITPSGLPFLWDHNETNPFTESSGSLKIINDSILKGLEYSVDKLKDSNCINDIELKIQNHSIIDSNLKSSILVTNPPYFDDIQYSELTDFFYVFENLVLKNIMELPSLTPKPDDLSVSGERSREKIDELYDDSFKKLFNILNDHGILVFYLTQVNVDVWDYQISSLIKNGFRITATWPIHIDNPLNHDNESLESPLIIVARKQLETHKVKLDDIKDELNLHLNNRFTEFWNYGLTGTDLTISAIGAVCDFITQFRVYKNFNKELTFHELLMLTQNCLIDYFLNKSLDYPMILDKPTLFYLYSKLNRLNAMSLDTANLITESIDTTLDSLESSGIIESIGKNSRKGVKLLKFNERKDLESEYLIDSLHYLMNIYKNKGIKEFKTSLGNNHQSSEIFNLLSAFTYFEVSDQERLTALEIFREYVEFFPREDLQTKI